MEPLQVVPATPPVEATLRILLNSVPYLIGVAVVRQPAGPDAISAEVGRNPWLFDRRLTTLELPDDTLPANRAVALDWPVPYQAEWVGVPPRLLISRLVFAGQTVGVLLGTLITREQLNARIREAIDLSCELIASAMAMHSAAVVAAPVPVPAPVPASPDSSPSSLRDRLASGMPPARPPAAALPPPLLMTAPEATPPAPTVPVSSDDAARIATIADQIRVAIEQAEDARAVGRVLRDVMNEVSEVSAFAVALFHADRPEVAYRYKVVGIDAASSELGKQPVDDSPRCYAVRNGERWHGFDRAVSVANERRRVAVLQVPLTDGTDILGVVTLETFRDSGFAGGQLEFIAAIVDATAPGFARARAAGHFQPGSAPALVPSPAAAPALPGAPGLVEPPAAPAEGATDAILRELLDRCALEGVPTSFIVGLDPAAGLLRGDRVSGSLESAELDKAIGISQAHFAISIDDRYNAIARACREARVIQAPTVHELIQPVHEWSEALIVERLVGGGRSTIVPIVVAGDVVGAFVAGPRFDDLDPITLGRIRGLVDDAGHRLSLAWRSASLGGAAAVDVPNETLMRLQGVQVA
ncbi:MAG TPA: hypothetical protein VHG53_00440 [Candidatus Limnocylindria bacterium]|nr:hypothetical protein [Candidatus Limnocylindria bacterium]